MEKRTVVVSLKMSAVLKGKLRSYAHKHHCTVSRAGADIMAQFLTPARDLRHGPGTDHVPAHEIVDLEYDKEHGVEILGPPSPYEVFLLEGHDVSA